MTSRPAKEKLASQKNSAKAPGLPKCGVKSTDCQYPEGHRGPHSPKPAKKAVKKAK